MEKFYTGKKLINKRLCETPSLRRSESKKKKQLYRKSKPQYILSVCMCVHINHCGLLWLFVWKRRRRGVIVCVKTYVRFY